ncbi:polysaccharide deacetylase family protein [Streptomyces sp. BH106]|uniref:polysaccharide deacetylase family protein n=1 Tax=Streptomyces sp. BH106 TaxID=3410409 RepID=UPI003CFBAD6D
MKWPVGKNVAVALTFDVDAEVGWNGYIDAEAYSRRLSLPSEGQFGPRRGLSRILSLLDRLELPATFFIPGHTAERHPDAVEAILERGHEVGHHGYDHLPVKDLEPDQQVAEIERGIAALESVGAPHPKGYRGPSAEITPETLALLTKHGFAYDSTCMGDDRPYYESCGDASILELPISNSLIDFVRFGYSADFGGEMQSAEALYTDWTAEYQFLRAEQGGAMIPVLHPEIIGRAYRFSAFERWVEQTVADGNAWFTSMSGLASHAGQQLGPLPGGQA